MKVYLDNGATSYPKPKGLEEALVRAITQYGGSLHRSQSDDALNLEREVYQTRLLIADFFGFHAVDHVVFTKNITESVNLVLNGFLEVGDHVVITSLEHNAVVRPLEYLRQTRGISYETIPFIPGEGLDFELLTQALHNKPKLMISTMASNVTGDLLDTIRMGELCKAYEVPFFIDTAQTAGGIEVDYRTLNASFLAFTGHKSLLGPSGIGGVLIDPSMAGKVKPFIYGGTGSLSDSLEQPEWLPDKFESGTQNTIGILGLKASLEFIQHIGIKEIRQHELELMTYFQKGLETEIGIRPIGYKNPSMRMGLLAISVPDIDPSFFVHELNKNYGISTRGGLHCAPFAHQTYGTYPKGSIRFGLSYFTSQTDLEYTIASVKKILKD
ncbi:aminotransferase class V-fold PLP-dependent enzyme [Fusibacter tunisiensis]|uniref:Cysteine desulfurase family protein n=1 Tax=Fusibacter tunisiensis TaxID=1008308 RepID=A0ABS2MNU9_9FIRM|nr:aminotransferase class V-fold PLP-dependent enzyme [Fusibacter tunisiensis]MBM7561073.1 cysteine desulfurase family protein [Fusibacter tunisiensis]